MDYKTKIKQTVFKQNALNTEAKRISTEAKTVLKDFLGKQITKKDHNLMAKVKEKLKDIVINKEVEHYKKGNKVKLNAYFLADEYSLYAKIQFCYIGDADKWGVCGSEYFEDYIYIGKIDKNILVEFCERDYKLLNEAEQIKIFKDTQKLLNEVINKKEKLHYRIKDYLNSNLKMEI